MWITTYWIIILDYLNPMVSVLTKNNLQEEKLTGNRRGACREEAHMKTEAKEELCSHKPRMPASPRGGRAKKVSPQGFWRDSSPCGCAVAKLCWTLCDPMDCITSGFPVLHYPPEFTQTHVHRVGDAIQHLIPCHPLLLLPSVFPTISVFSNESALHIR